MAERDQILEMSVLIAAVDGGSFTTAARHHDLTPSGVSKIVSRLERRLGVRLLQRSTRRMTLTDDGARFCERARAILAEVAGLEREMASRHGVPSGQVRLSVPLTFGEIVVMPALIEFQRRFPQVRLDVELSDRVVDFFEQPIDLAIRMTSEPPAAAIARKIGDDRRVLCASPAYLRAHPRPRTARDLADHDCILFAGRRAASEWGLLAAPGSSTIEAVQVRGRMRCNNTRSLHLAARAGLGIANLPLYLVRDDLQEGALVTVLDELVPGDRSIYLVYPAARFMPTAVRELVTFLVDAFAAAPQTRAVPRTRSRTRR